MHIGVLNARSFDYNNRNDFGIKCASPSKCFHLAEGIYWMEEFVNSQDPKRIISSDRISLAGQRARIRFKKAG